MLDTRVVYCGDNLEQLAKPALSLSNGLPAACVDLIYIDPPFNSNRPGGGGTARFVCPAAVPPGRGAASRGAEARPA